MSDLAWFDAICGVLTRANKPTFHSVRQLLGTPSPTPPRHARNFFPIAPFGNRFEGIANSPDIDEDAPDMPIDSLTVWGPRFSLLVADVVARFPRYKKYFNAYDDGTDIFFHPVPDEYEFTAVKLWTELEDVWNPTRLTVHSVNFGFGDTLFRARDGYHMRR